MHNFRLKSNDFLFSKLIVKFKLTHIFRIFAPLKIGNLCLKICRTSSKVPLKI